MKLGKNSRKKLKAVRRALMLGLPVAGLLVAAGCEKSTSDDESKDTWPVVSEGERLRGRTIGVVCPKEDHKIGGDFGDRLGENSVTNNPPNDL